MKYILIGSGILFSGIIIAYIILSKKMQKSEYRQMKKLQEGTKANTFSKDILYQKLYLTTGKTDYYRRNGWQELDQYISRKKTHVYYKVLQEQK